MPLKITMTSKRQATFPAVVCESLAVGPGDTLELNRIRFDGRQVWLLAPEKKSARPWLGALRTYAERKTSHDMSIIRRAVARKLGETP